MGANEKLDAARHGTVTARGGTHRFAISDDVQWMGRPAKVIALTVEPSVTIEFEGGDRLTVGQSVLERRTPRG